MDNESGIEEAIKDVEDKVNMIKERHLSKKRNESTGHNRSD